MQVGDRFLVNTHELDWVYNTEVVITRIDDGGWIWLCGETGEGRNSLRGPIGCFPIEDRLRDGKFIRVTQESEAQPTEAPLTFARLRQENAARCNEVFFPLTEWSPNDWMTALVGEVGELANLLKKRHRAQTRGRTDPTTDRQIADEIADVQCYLDLLAARLGINLAEATARKFNQVSEREGSPRRL